jgi:hypothetical protein
MKRLFLFLALLFTLPSLCHATATTVELWSDFNYVYSRTVKGGNYTDHHDTNAYNYLYRGGSLVASGQSGYTYGNASVTLSTGWTNGYYDSNGQGLIFCYLANAVVENTSSAAPRVTAGSSIICMNKQTSQTSPAHPWICTNGYWEQATYSAAPGCNVKCASLVYLTIPWTCGPLSYTYAVSKRWVVSPNGMVCSGQNFVVQPTVCTGANCMEMTY